MTRNMRAIAAKMDFTSPGRLKLEKMAAAAATGMTITARLATAGPKVLDEDAVAMGRRYTVSGGRAKSEVGGRGRN